MSLARGSSIDTNIANVTPPSGEIISNRRQGQHPHAEAMRSRIRSDSNLLQHVINKKF